MAYYDKRKAREARSRARDRKEAGREAIKYVLETYQLPPEIIEKLKNMLPHEVDHEAKKMWRIYVQAVYEEIMAVLMRNSGKKMPLQDIVNAIEGTKASSQLVVTILEQCGYRANSRIYMKSWHSSARDIIEPYKNICIFGDIVSSTTRTYTLPDGRQLVKKERGGQMVYWVERTE